MVEASPIMNEYFKSIQDEVDRCHRMAKVAREKNLDPTSQVEVSLAANMAERVVGLISVLAPQIVGCGVVERIIALEKQYGALDWRVAMKISEEIALQKFCKFDDQKTAIGERDVL